MKKKLLKYGKILMALTLIGALALPSYATVGAADGSAFVTKAEFDAALSDFNARLTTFEAGINSKIDSQVSSYLDRNGIWNGKEQTIPGKYLYIYGPQGTKNQDILSSTGSAANGYTTTAGSYVVVSSLSKSGLCNVQYVTRGCFSSPMIANGFSSTNKTSSSTSFYPRFYWNFTDAASSWISDSRLELRWYTKKGSVKTDKVTESFQFNQWESNNATQWTLRMQVFWFIDNAHTLYFFVDKNSTLYLDQFFKLYNYNGTGGTLTSQYYPTIEFKSISVY